MEGRWSLASSVFHSILTPECRLGRHQHHPTLSSASSAQHNRNRPPPPAGTQMLADLGGCQNHVCSTFRRRSRHKEQSERRSRGLVQIKKFQHRGGDVMNREKCYPPHPTQPCPSQFTTRCFTLDASQISNRVRTSQTSIHPNSHCSQDQSRSLLGIGAL